MLGSKEERTKEIKRQAQELIDQAYERGFKVGKEAFVGTGAKVVNEAYQRGLDDAWECARKIVNAYTLASVENPNGLHKVFGDYLTAHTFDMSPSEAIAKIKDFEEQKKAESEKIKVGDEVVGNFGFCGVVVGIDLRSNNASVLNTKYTVPQMCLLNDLRRKTGGRHFPQIAEVLKQLQEGNG